MNKWLKGNGLWCAACNGAGRGKPRDMIEYEGGTYCLFYDPCPVCKGEKRVAAEVADVIAQRVPETAPAFHSILLNTHEYGRLDKLGRRIPAIRVPRSAKATAKPTRRTENQRVNPHESHNPQGGT